MGGDIVPELLPEIITAVIAVLIHWIKRPMDKGLDELKTSLTNLHNNVSTATTLFDYRTQPKCRLTALMRFCSSSVYGPFGFAITRS